MISISFLSPFGSWQKRNLNRALMTIRPSSLFIVSPTLSPIAITWQQRKHALNSTSQPSLGLSFSFVNKRGFELKWQAALKNWSTVLQKSHHGVLLLRMVLGSAVWVSAGGLLEMQSYRTDLRLIKEHLHLLRSPRLPIGTLKFEKYFPKYQG